MSEYRFEIYAFEEGWSVSAKFSRNGEVPREPFLHGQADQ